MHQYLCNGLTLKAVGLLNSAKKYRSESYYMFGLIAGIVFEKLFKLHSVSKRTTGLGIDYS